MASLYAQYVLERQGVQTMEHEDGFATYLIQAPYVYILDLFVRKELRRSGIASDLADRICVLARQQQCTELIGTIDPSTHGANESLLGLIAYGMRLSRIQGNLLIFTKSLAE